MLFFVNVIISSAMSTSRIREFASVKFSCVVFKLLIVWPTRFCAAPRLERCSETVAIASSIFLIASEEFSNPFEDATNPALTSSITLLTILV